MTFRNPYYLLLLLILLAYVIFYIRYFNKFVPSLKMPEVERYKNMTKTWRQRLIHIPMILRCILITLVICILARPQISNSWTDHDVEGIDIMLAVDISTSMLAQDFHPNRIQALKRIAQTFIDKRINDNIGLTFFAGESYTQCPLTTDHAVLMNLYSGADEEMAAKGIIDDGTAIGDGIMNSLLRLRESKSKSKVIILLTDGVNNAGNISPQTAAEIARQQGVRIYTIGIGKNGMAPMPMPAPYSGTMQIPVEIDETMMKKIAKETGGQYFRATDNDKLIAIYEDIDKMEKTKHTSQQFNRRYEAYMPFAIASMIVLLLELTIRIILYKRIP